MHLKAHARATRALTIVHKYLSLRFVFGRSAAFSMNVARRQWGRSEATVYRYLDRTRGVPEELWYWRLLPAFAGRKVRAEFTPEAWRWLIHAYKSGRGRLRDCIAELRRIAPDSGWRVPSDRTICRRISGARPWPRERRKRLPKGKAT